MKANQNIKYSALFNSSISQFFNSFENKDLLEYLLSNELGKIENLLEARNYEGAKAEIDSIFTTKEKLPDEIELKLKYLKGNIEIELENYKGLKVIIEILRKNELGRKNALELEYKYAIKINDESLMNKCIEMFKEYEDDNSLLERKMRFYFNNGLIFKNLEFIKEVEENKLESKEIFYYLSVGYLNNRDYINAKMYSEEAIKLGIGDIGVYVSILSDVNSIIERRGIILTISDEEKVFLRCKVELLEELISKLPKEIELEIVSIILNILLIIDLEKAKQYFNQNEKLFGNSIEGKLLNASIEELDNNFEKAKQIYIDILNDNKKEGKIYEEILIKIMVCMRATDDYEKYIKLFEQYKDNIIDNNFILTEFYLISIQAVCGEEKMKEILMAVKEKYSNQPRYIILLADIEEDYDNKYKLLCRAEERLKYSDEMDRDFLKSAYWKINKYEEAIKVVQPILKYKEILISTIKMVLSKNRKEFYLDLINEIDKYNDIELKKYKRDMLYFLERVKEAKEVAKEIYEKDSDVQSLRFLIKLKLELNDSKNLEELLIKLIPSDIPMDYMIVACGYALIGDVNRYNTYSYEAIFMTRGVYNEGLYKLCVQINFRLAYLGKEESKEIKTVTEDTVVILSSSEEKIAVCLNKEEKYQINEEVCGVLHINKKDNIWVELVEQKVGDLVEYNDKQFIIEDIQDKYVIFHQYCFGKLDMKSMGDGFKTITIEELPIVMKEVSESSENNYKIKFDMYNFKDNEVGLPFSKVFYGDKLELSFELLNILLTNDKHSFYIGDNNNNFNCGNIVISYQTLLLLEHYNLLDIILKEPKKYYVSSSTRDTITSQIINLKQNSKQIMLGYNLEDDKMYRYERNYSEIIEKLKRINRVLHKINIEDISYEITDEIINYSSEFITDMDIDNIYLANKLNAGIIVDDLFTRKLINACFPSLVHNNVSYFLNKLLKDNPKMCYYVLEKMIKDKVKYVVNNEMFIEILTDYKKLGLDFEWFKDLISKMIEDNDHYYRSVMYSACQHFVTASETANYLNELLLIAIALDLFPRE